MKVHHTPGGQQSYNIFGADPDADKDRFAGKGQNAPAAVAAPEQLQPAKSQ